MKNKLLAAFVLVAIGIGCVTTTDAQVGVWHTHNDFGVAFWGQTPGAAMWACRTNTPYGHICYSDGYY